MRTNLPPDIMSVHEAKCFLRSLWLNNESYHPEDLAKDIIWNLPEEQRPTNSECVQLDKLMSDIYGLGINSIDPCQYLLDLDSKAYSIAEAKDILLRANAGEETDYEFSEFIASKTFDHFIPNSGDFEQWCLKATWEEIVAKFIEIYYPL